MALGGTPHDHYVTVFKVERLGMGNNRVVAAPDVDDVSGEKGFNEPLPANPVRFSSLVHE